MGDTPPGSASRTAGRSAADASTAEGEGQEGKVSVWPFASFDHIRVKENKPCILHARFAVCGMQLARPVHRLLSCQSWLAGWSLRVGRCDATRLQYNLTETDIF